MVIGDRTFPLCELLVGAAHADHRIARQEMTEIRALMVELAGEVRVEVEACIASFDADRFDLNAAAAVFRDDPEPDRRRLLLLVIKVCEVDDVIEVAESDYLRTLTAALGLPESALDGLTVDIELEDITETFHAIRKGPPPLPPSRRT
jgi:uncharacterized membrane protein YebE (DUF533 family)